MNRREFIPLLGGAAAGPGMLCPLRLAAQEPRKIPRVGYLSPAELTLRDAFRQRLHDLGYVEGKNIVVEYRFAEGKFDRLPAFAHSRLARRSLALRPAHSRCHRIS
jgi:Fe2+ transport system protein FeoA